MSRCPWLRGFDQAKNLQLRAQFKIETIHRTYSQNYRTLLSEVSYWGFETQAPLQSVGFLERFKEKTIEPSEAQKSGSVLQRKATGATIWASLSLLHQGADTQVPTPKPYLTLLSSVWSAGHCKDGAIGRKLRKAARHRLDMPLIAPFIVRYFKTCYLCLNMFDHFWSFAIWGFP